MVFDNVNIEFQNVSFGPDSGRVYTIDHEADVMFVKTNPGGATVATIPLDTAIQNEVKTFDYDGLYFWTQSDIGFAGNLGTVINKWAFNSTGTILEKQTGVGNEIVLVNGIDGITFETEAMCVHRVQTSLAFFATSGSTSITVDDASLLEIGQSVYLGPSTAASGEIEEHEIIGIAGSGVTLATPLGVSFNFGDSVISRKNIWIFNNRNGSDPVGGSLVRVDSYTGTVLGYSSSAEWKNVTAATSANNNLAFVRGSQYLEFRPLGVNAGYQKSMILENIKNDRTSIIKVYDIAVDDVSVHKLQTERHVFNSTTKDFDDEESLNDNYNIDREFFASRVKSLAAIRTTGLVFGNLDVEQFTVIVLDQYNIPVFGNAISVQEDDASGFIESGFESFVTDIDGKGVSRYNTGNSPDFSQPTVTSIDLASELRLSMRLDQIPGVDNLSYVEQIQEAINRGFVEQVDAISNLNVLQSPPLESFMFVEQSEPPETGIPVIQQILDPSIPIIQEQELGQTTTIEQRIAVSDTIDINQFDFLLTAIPVPFSQKNDPFTDILVRIAGFGAIPLDSSTLVFKVNGADITSEVQVTPFAGGLELFYDPPGFFAYSSTVSVDIEIQDTDSPPNTISTLYTFGIVDDFRRPFLQEVFPPNNSEGNLTDTEIYAIIKDPETGIDLDSIEMYVEGRAVDFTTSEPFTGCIKVSHITTCEFSFDSEIAVAILAADNQGNKFVGSWSFRTKTSSGVLFINSSPENCSVLVPVNTKISTEVFGQSEGIHVDSLTFDINGEKVQYILKPKVYRKE